MLFASFRYHISPSFPSTRIEELRHVLERNGATSCDGEAWLKEVNLVVSNSMKFEGWEDIRERNERKKLEGEGEEVYVVTDKWVDRSLVLGKIQSPYHYSTDPSLIFSGIIACATSLPPSDLEVLSAGITALGGQWRTGLTKDVTHLFAMSPDSQKYATAMHFREETGVKIVLPHWFDDVVRLGMGGLSTDVYEWPDPELLKNPLAVGGGGCGGGGQETGVKKNMYALAALFTAPMHESSSPPLQDLELAVANRIEADVWKGKKIVLSRTLQLFEGRREAVQIGIERAGGIVVRYDGDEEPDEGFAGGQDSLSKREKERRKSEAEKVLESDVLVTRWRDGPAYIAALRSHKTIGTLPWLFHVQSTGTLTRPLDQLLHYPVPKRPIEAFSNHVITVTNYTGEAREYLKKLIIAMGAKFTPSMSGQNTVLIAAHISGTKATKAQSWSIPIVNHTWLEDCFIQWRNLTVGLEKYIAFPNGVDFSKLLGVRGVGAVLEEGLDEKMDEGGEGEAPLGTDASLKEVQGLIVSEDVDMTDVRAGQVGGEEDPAGLKMDVDEEDEEERTPTKKTYTKVSTSKPKVNGRDTSPAPLSIPTSSRISPKKAIVEPEEIDDEEEEGNAYEKQKRQTKTKTKSWVSSPEGDEEEVEPTRIQKQKKTARKRPASSSEEEIEGDEEDESEVELFSSKVAKTNANGKDGKEEKVQRRSKKAEDDDDSGVEVVSSKIAKTDLNAKGKAKEKEKAKAGSKKKEVKQHAKKSKSKDEDEEQDEDEMEVVVEEEAASTKTKSKKATSTEKTKVQPRSTKSKPRDQDEEKEEEEEEEEEDPKSKGIGKGAKARNKRKSLDDDDEEEEQDKESRIKSKAKTKASPIKYTTPTKPTISSKRTTSAKPNAKPKASELAPVESEDDSEDEVSPAPPVRNTRLIRRVSGVTDVLPAVEDRQSSSSEREDREDREAKAKPRLSLIEKSQAKRGDARTRVRKRKIEVVEVEVEEDEEEEEEEPVVLVKSTSSKGKGAKAQAKETKKGKEKARVHAQHSEEEEEDNKPQKPSKKSVTKSGKSTKSAKFKPTSISDDDSNENSPSDNNDSDSDLPPAPLLSSIKNIGGSTTKSKSKKPVASTSASAPPLAKSKSTTKSRPKDRPRVTAESEDEDEDDARAVVSTPKRSISVLMPSFNLSGNKKKGGAGGSADMKDAKVNGKKKTKFSVSSEEDEEDEDEEPEVLVSPRSRAITRTESIRVMSGHQVSAKYPGATASGSASAVVKKNANTAASKTKTKPTPIDNDSPPPSTKIKTSPRNKPQSPILKRSAATKATQRLHDTIMPDLVHFESQMKRANAKGRKSGGLSAFKVEGDNESGGKRSQTGDPDGEEEERLKKRRRVDEDDDDMGGNVGAKGKGKRKAHEEEDEEDDDIVMVSSSKAAKTKSKGKEKEVETPSKSGVVLLTTQVTLSDEVIRVLTKLGVKMTSRPSECTHLLAPQLVRTEKFLCALVVAPFILTEKWAVQSATVKKLLPEKDFVLHDPSGENKYGVNLKQSLRRAKELGGKLLAGQTFYVTPKVPVDTKLLKNVVTACGGQVTTQQPTVRIINGSPQTRHVISCKEDIAMWRSIAAQGIPIYSQELLLTGVLKQEVEWGNDELRVDV